MRDIHLAVVQMPNVATWFCFARTILFSAKKRCVYAGTVIASSPTFCLSALERRKSLGSLIATYSSYVSVHVVDWYRVNLKLP